MSSVTTLLDDHRIDSLAWSTIQYLMKIDEPIPVSLVGWRSRIVGALVEWWKYVSFYGEQDDADVILPYLDGVQAVDDVVGVKGWAYALARVEWLDIEDTNDIRIIIPRAAVACLSFHLGELKRSQP